MPSCYNITYLIDNFNNDTISTTAFELIFKQILPGLKDYSTELNLSGYLVKQRGINYFISAKLLHSIECTTLPDIVYLENIFTKVEFY